MHISANPAASNQASAQVIRSTEMMNELTQNILEKKTELSKKLLQLSVTSQVSESGIGTKIDIRG